MKLTGHLKPIYILLPFLLLFGCENDNPFSVFEDSDFDVKVEINGDYEMNYQFDLDNGVPDLDRHFYNSSYWLSTSKYERSDSLIESDNVSYFDIQISCIWTCDIGTQQRTTLTFFSKNYNKIEAGTFQIGDYHSEWEEDLNNSPIFYLKLKINDPDINDFSSMDGIIRIVELDSGDFEVQIEAESITDEESPKRANIKAKLVLYNG